MCHCNGSVARGTSDRPNVDVLWRCGVYLAVALVFAALVLIGHFWALFDPRRQSLQDRLFGLAVVHANPKEEPTLATPVST